MDDSFRKNLRGDADSLSQTNSRLNLNIEMHVADFPLRRCAKIFHAIILLSVSFTVHVCVAVNVGWAH